MLCLNGAGLHLYDRVMSFAGGPKAAVALALTLLGACQMPAGTEAGVAAPVAAETVTPIAAVSGGGADPMRVQRSYFAASGRECREVVSGFGGGERASLVCQDPAGGWMPARPLLRGGGVSSAGIARP